MNRRINPPPARAPVLAWCLALAGLWSGLPAPAQANPPRGLNTLPQRPLIFGYINELRTTNHHLQELARLDYEAVDVLVHGFVEPKADGSVGPGLGKFALYRAPLLQQARARQRSVVLSVGGGLPDRLRAAFASLSASEARRLRFAEQLLQVTQAWGYDGVDLDYEFPSDALERARFTQLMQAVHRRFKAASTNYLVMFGVSTGFYVDQYDWAQLAACTDFAFYFGYNWKNPANGPWANPGIAQWLSGGRERTEASARGALHYILNRGFPPEKLIYGLPFYSSANDSWPVLRDIWSTNRPYFSNAINNASLEVPFAGRWWTTPESVQRKLSMVLDPAHSQLPNRSVLRGAGFWEFGHQDTAKPDLTTAIKEWLAARTNLPPAVSTSAPPTVPPAVSPAAPPAAPAPARPAP
jgi:hypothetical protein